MGLRCLLGHDYGDTRTEHEREERGDEIVVTVTEVEECSRCGKTRVVSENTEVKRAADSRGTTEAVGTAAPGGAAEASQSEGTPGASPSPDQRDRTVDHAEAQSGASETGPASTPAEEDAEIVIDEAEPERDAPDSATAGTGAEADAGTPADAGVEPDRDVETGTGGDAERVETDPSVETDPGVEADESVSVSEPGATDDTSTETPTDDAEILDDDSDEPRERERQPGEWPDAESTHPADATRTDDDAEIVDPDPVEESTAAAEARRDVVEDVNVEGGVAESAENDDAEIVDGDDSHARSDRTDSGWPSHDGEDEGYDAETGIDAGGETSSVSVDGSLRPEVDQETLEDEDVEFIESSPDPEPSREDTNGAAGAHGSETDPVIDSVPSEVPDSAGSGVSESPSPSGPPVDLSPNQQDVDSEYFCPDCGHAEAVGASSMRKGDICPECMRGYIDERVIE
jgi:hypothetical protein